ncbi:MAG TPA: NAD-binding protein [Streptosporangiaceae bacterium]|nr:NAD-binding protein [Streptosporangiaceae bacterium]
MSEEPRVRAGRDHLVVCGDDALASRMVEELTLRYGEEVTVILPSAQRNQGPRIARLPGVRLIERSELDHQAFLAADVPTARGIALLHQDDLGNFHAALRAQELNADLRLVVAIFNTSLGERIRTFFTDCAVLSESSMAAPSFIAAALGEPTPSHIRLAGRTLYLARREDAHRAQVICGVAYGTDGGSPRLTPPQEAGSELVLAVADGTPRNPLARQRRNPLRAAARLLRMLFWHRFGAAFGCLLAILGVGFTLLATAVHYSAGDALYLTFLDAAGAAVSNPALSTPEKVAQFLLTFDGMAFLPLVTAAVVGARLTGSIRARDRPISDHVIVAGLGNVGTRILGQLHDLGIGVVCVDKDADAAGIPLARRLGLRVVIGETTREETLLAAGVASCRALVSVTDSDIVNLETALHARALAEKPRIVLRLYDDDLAERVQKTVGNTISRSVPYLAAPAFAAAMLEHQVLRTIPVGRHVLLIADVPVGAGADLAGRRVDDVHDGSAARLIALRRRGEVGVDWRPRPGDELRPQDALVVVATRAGLSRVLARSRSQ